MQRQSEVHLTSAVHCRRHRLLHGELGTLHSLGVYLLQSLTGRRAQVLCLLQLVVVSKTAGAPHHVLLCKRHRKVIHSHRFAADSFRSLQLTCAGVDALLRDFLHNTRWSIIRHCFTSGTYRPGGRFDSSLPPALNALPGGRYDSKRFPKQPEVSNKPLGDYANVPREQLTGASPCEL